MTSGRPLLLDTEVTFSSFSSLMVSKLYFNGSAAWCQTSSTSNPIFAEVWSKCKARLQHHNTSWYRNELSWCLYISAWNSSALPEHISSALIVMQPLDLTAYFMSCKHVSQLFSLPEWLTDRIRPLMLLLPVGNSQYPGGKIHETAEIKFNFWFMLLPLLQNPHHMWINRIDFWKQWTFYWRQATFWTSCYAQFCRFIPQIFSPVCSMKKEMSRGICWRFIYFLHNLKTFLDIKFLHYVITWTHLVRHRNVDIYWNKQIAIKCPARSTKKEAFLALEISKITFFLRNISPDELKHSFIVMSTLQLWISAVWAFFSESTLDRNKAKLS